MPIECTKLTPKCIWQNGVVPKCCSEHMKELAIYTCKLFNELGIQYWLDQRLLVSALNGTFEPSLSKNVISYFKKDFSKIANLNLRVLEDGYYLTTNEVRKSTWIQIFYSNINSNAIDLIDCGVMKNVARYNPVFPTLPKTISLDNILPLQKVDFFGTEVNIPAKPNELLKGV